MNITIFSLRGPTANGVRGGAREYIHEIAKRLVNEGHKVFIICGAEPKHNLYESEELEGVNIIRVGTSKWAVFSIIYYYFKNLRKNTDIIIENIVSFPMYTTLLSRSKRHFTIIHHLTDKEYFKTHHIMIALLGYFMEKKTIKIFYKQSKFIAVSKHTKDQLIKNGINVDMIEIVNPGIRSNYFEPGKKSIYPEIFYVGRFSAYGGNKRVDHLIEAFKKLELKIPNAKLIIGGKGDGVDILKQMSKGSNIKFCGLIDDIQKKMYMQRAWVFASPSLAEGFGITWIEANACGTPVVGYKIEGLNTVNEKTSIMVKAGDVVALTEALIKLCMDRLLLDNMTNDCVENGKKYTWEKSFEIFNSILINTD